MVDEKKRARNSKLIGLFIAVIAVLIFVLALYMGAGMQ
jgi:uncharacterized membrane protein